MAISMTIEMQDYYKSFAQWNVTYSNEKICDLSCQPLTVEPMFDARLSLFSEECPYVLDYGCGTGDILFQCFQNGNTASGLGVDLSDTGIRFARQTADKSGYSELNFLQGDISVLSQYEAGAFDGIILSNVIDVMPFETAHSLFNRLTELLTDQGLIFLKLNPFYSKEELASLGLIPLKDTLYQKDGILCLNELPTASWYNFFEPSFLVERYLEFPYDWQKGMNRLFLLRKKCH